MTLPSKRLTNRLCFWLIDTQPRATIGSHLIDNGKFPRGVDYLSPRSASDEDFAHDVLAFISEVEQRWPIFTLRYILTFSLGSWVKRNRTAHLKLHMHIEEYVRFMKDGNHGRDERAAISKCLNAIDMKMYRRHSELELLRVLKAIDHSTTIFVLGGITVRGKRIAVQWLSKTPLLEFVFADDVAAGTEFLQLLHRVIVEVTRPLLGDKEFGGAVLLVPQHLSSDSNQTSLRCFLQLTEQPLRDKWMAVLCGAMNWTCPTDLAIDPVWLNYKPIRKRRWRQQHPKTTQKKINN